MNLPRVVEYSLQVRENPMSHQKPIHLQNSQIPYKHQDYFKIYLKEHNFKLI